MLHRLSASPSTAAAASLTGIALFKPMKMQMACAQLLLCGTGTAAYQKPACHAACRLCRMSGKGSGLFRCHCLSGTRA